MFEDWQDYYLLIGSAGAALIGLVFVVVTLNSRVDRTTALRGAALYMTPLVFSFGVVTALSGMAMAPGLSSHVVAGLVGAIGFWGMAHCIFVGYGMRRGTGQITPFRIDFVTYSVIPGLLHAGLVATAVAFWTGSEAAPRALAGLLMVLLLITIRNAWDLVTWIAPQGEKSQA